MLYFSQIIMNYKNLLHKGVYLILIALLPCISYAQTSGYQGKRFCLKADIANLFLKREVNISAEYALLRQVSLEGGFLFTDTHYKQNIVGYEKFYKVPSPDKASVKDIQIHAKLKIYHSNVIPAPKGSYTFIGYNYGRATVKGNYFIYSNQNPKLHEYLQYVYPNVRSSNITGGFGYQDILFDVLMIDFGLGISFGTLNAVGKTDTDTQAYNTNMNAFANKYGTNLSFGQWQLNKSGGFGLATYLKIGVLLF